MLRSVKENRAKHFAEWYVLECEGNTLKLLSELADFIEEVAAMEEQNQHNVALTETENTLRGEL